MHPELSSRESPGIPREILERLRRFRRRLIVLRSGAALGLTVALAGVLLAGALALDRFLILSTAERGALTAAAIGAAAAAAIASAAWALRPLPLFQLARRIESREPALEEGLLTSVELGHLSPREIERFSPHLVGGLHRTTAAKLARIPPGRLADPRPARALLIAAALVWAAVGAFAAARPEPFRLLAARFLHPGLDLPRPSTVRLAISPGDARVEIGADVEVRARLERGRAPEAIVLSRTGGEEWTAVHRAFEAAPGRDAVEAAHVFSALRRPIEYRVRAGDYLSPVHRIEPREPPRPAAFRITYRYPSYTRRPPETVERPGGDLVALRGTVADVEVEASEPLARARWIPIAAGQGAGPRPPERGSPGEAARDLEVAGETAVARGIEVSAPSSYALLLQGLDGVTNGGGAVYSIRPLADRPPSVEILEPRAAEASVEEASFLDVRYIAEDDVGLVAIDLILDAPPGKETAVPLLAGAAPGGEAATNVHATHRIDPAAIGARPGEAVAFRLIARDGAGAEARSADRSLRIAPIPGPPEGPGWLERLGAIEEELALLVREWGTLLPRPGGEAPGTLAADPARAENLLRAAEDALAVLAHLARTAGRADELGRSIRVPSPNRRALENLASLLRRTAREECAAFWAEAAAVAGKLRAAGGRAAGNAPADVPAANLHAVHRAAGARMEDALSEMRSIARAERVEEALERAIALEVDALALEALPPAAGGAGRRAKDLARESLSLAAEVSRLAGAAHPPGEKADRAEAALLEAARLISGAGGADAGEGGPRGALELALPGLAAAAAALGERYAKEEEQAAAARSRLEPGPAIETAIERLAAALAPGAAPGNAGEAAGVSPPNDPGGSAHALAISAIALVADELATVEAMEYADIDSASDLRLVRGLLETVVPGVAAAARGAVDREGLAALAGEVLAAHRATAPSRRIGRSIQEIDRAAGGEEEIAGRLRGASPGNHRAVRHIARAEREVLRALEAARRPLAALEASVPPLGEVLPILGEASRGIEEALAAIEAARGGAAPAAIEGAATAAAGASARLDEAVEALERVRSSALPEAAAARARLRSRLGSLAERIARLAGLAREHAARTREASGAADEPGSAARVSDLLGEAEEIRGETARLQGAAREEGNRLLASGASVERLRLHDAAALQLGAIASGDLLAAVRALRESDSADRAARAGLILEAAVREEKAAAGLEAIARAFAAIDADEALRLAREELAGLLAPAPGSAGPPSPADVARDARAFLDATLRAAETVSSRLGPGALRDAVVEALRSAAGLFRTAIEEAERPDAVAALAAYRAGRARLEEAVRLLEEAQRAAEGAVAEAEKALSPPARDEDGKGKTAEMTRDVEAAYAELEKLIALRALAKDLSSRIDALLGEREPPARELEEVERLARAMEEEIGGSHLSMDELVALVAKLIAIDRRSRDVAAEARSLAATAAAAAREALAAGQARVRDGAGSAASEFHAAGFKLSAVLPHVLRAYYEGSDALEPFLLAAEAAAREPPGGALQEKLLDAAGKAEAFAGKVELMRRAALEALADLERGDTGGSSAQGDLERARRSLRETAQLLRDGRIDAAASAQKASARSIADAAGSIRARLGEVLLPGEEGGLGSRVLDEEAARLGLAWSVTARGEEGAGARAAGPEEMPFPAEFRELIRVYLEALSRERRR
jgi:hypothetical protein